MADIKVKVKRFSIDYLFYHQETDSVERGTEICPKKRLTATKIKEIEKNGDKFIKVAKIVPIVDVYTITHEALNTYGTLIDSSTCEEI